MRVNSRAVIDLQNTRRDAYQVTHLGTRQTLQPLQIAAIYREVELRRLRTVLVSRPCILFQKDSGCELVRIFWKTDVLDSYVSPPCPAIDVQRIHGYSCFVVEIASSDNIAPGRHHGKAIAFFLPCPADVGSPRGILLLLSGMVFGFKVQALNATLDEIGLDNVDLWSRLRLRLKLRFRLGLGLGCRVGRLGRFGRVCRSGSIGRFGRLGRIDRSGRSGFKNAVLVLGEYAMQVPQWFWTFVFWTLALAYRLVLGF